MESNVWDYPGKFTIEQSEEFGQYLRASEDIPAGTLILEESPAFFGPSADYVEDYTTPICTACCVVMNDGNENYRCAKCNWPLCSPHCDKASYHEEFECSLFCKEKVVFPPENLPIQNCYKGLTILRGLLLRKKNGKMWEKVMNLQFHNEIKDSEEQDFNEFRTQFGLYNFSTNEEWATVLGILNVNSYSIQRIEKKIGSPSFAEFIYPYQCLMNHSCVPCVNWVISYSPEFIIKAKASVDIKKGTMLTVAYNYDLCKYGCNKRQQKIKEQAKFTCKCPLCLDPTDSGTYSGGIICFKCKKGVMLPICSIELESDWKCNQCQYSMCQSFVSSFVNGLHEQVEMAQAEAEEIGEPVVDVLEDFISENKDTVLHPNHWVLSLASQSIINEQNSRLHELSVPELDTFIGHCQHILGIRNMITSGISTEKGILQHHIARAKFRRMELVIQETSLSNSNDIEEEVKTIFSLQKETVIFWEENPHFGTLHANYKLDAQMLKEEMNQLLAKYPFLNSFQ